MALPIRPVTRPAILTGQTNGRLPDALLVNVPGLAGAMTVRLVAPAARAWRALSAAALHAGHTLKVTSRVDSYRPYEIQEAVFRQRYTTEVLPDRPYRVWDGVRWYQRPGTAPCAVPGTSNHGWGLAVDVGEERDGDTGVEDLSPATLAWLVTNEQDYGWSHEMQIEPWHIRYWAGDAIPAAVLAYEQGDAMPTAAEIWNTDGLIPAPTDRADPANEYWTAANMLHDIADSARAATKAVDVVRAEIAAMRAQLANIPPAGLTPADVEQAVQAALAPGLHLPS